MKLISHRGNLKGPNPEQENHPDYIWDALSQLNELDPSGLKLNYFSHESDLGVLTSRGYIWSANVYKRGILVLPEFFATDPTEDTLGVCSDYITNYK